MKDTLRSKIVYHLLLFLFLFKLWICLLCCLTLCYIGIAAFNLTITFLAFNQLLFCSSKYVTLFPLMIFCLAVLKSIIFILFLYPLWYCVASSLWLSFFFFPFVFSVFFCSCIPCLIFSSFTATDCNILCILLKPFGVLPAKAIYTFRLL